MHQSTQRRICRLVFVAGCVLPTLAVAAWATVERLPSTQVLRLATVEQRLGLRVAARSLATPTPGVYRAQGVQLTDFETGELVLEADLATLRSTEGNIQLQLAGTTIAYHELQRLAESACRTLAIDWPHDMTIRLADLEWQGEVPPAARTLVGNQSLTVKLRTIGHAQEISGREFTFRLGNASDGPQLAVHRNRQVTPPATRVVANTFGQTVPAEWLAQLGGLLPEGSPSATFAGELSVVHEARTSSGRLLGELAGVSLEAMTQLPIDATATVSDLKLEWEDNRVTTAAGVLIAGPGTLGSDMARTLQSLYQSPQAGASTGDDQPLPFGALGVTFVMTAESLSLWGACPASDATSGLPLIVDNHANVLFGQPDYQAPLRSVSAVLTTYGQEGAAGLAARLPRPSALRR